MKNRFYKNNDDFCERFLIKLEPLFFWSRRYEYHHIYSEIQKQNPKAILDAASGSYHPFKFKLAQDGHETYACDLDALCYESVKSEMSRFDYNISKELFDSVKFSIGDITKLQYEDNQFDAIVCISVIEHLPSEQDIRLALSEFRRTLSKNGRIYLTVDYPNVSPETLFTIAHEVGLRIDGPIDYTRNDDNITTTYFGGQLWCYNMILRNG